MCLDSGSGSPIIGKCSETGSSQRWKHTDDVYLLLIINYIINHKSPCKPHHFFVKRTLTKIIKVVLIVQFEKEFYFALVGEYLQFF